MPEFDKFMFDATTNPHDFWLRFAPEESLSSPTNYYTLYHASETLKKILEGWKETREDLKKIEWLIFSCWDHYKSPPKYFITLFALRNGNNELKFINPFEESGTQYLLNNLNAFKEEIIAGCPNYHFKNFIEWWEKEDFNRTPEIHFWDFLHSHKKFEWTICLTKNSSPPPDAFTVKINAPASVSYHPPDKIKDLPKRILTDEWWHFDHFPPELRSGTPTKDIFEKLATGYVDLMCPKNGFIYELPLLMDIEISANSSASYRSLGSLSIGAKEKLNLAEWEKLVYRYIQGFYQIFPMRSFFERAKQNALRSAVGSIMARNMSHNIGSHVSPRATIEKIEQRLSDLKFSLTAEAKLKILRLLKGELDDYNQKKSDFLSEITTEPLTTTAPALFYREVVLPFTQNSLLMDNLAANEGVNYRDQNTNRLRLRLKVNDHELKAVYQTKTGESSTPKYTYPDRLPYTLYESNSSASDDKLLYVTNIVNGDEDVLVELPGPLGKFAFYAFLENLIRNTAKHNKKHFDSSSDNALEIMISIKDHDKFPDEFYQVEIFDNVTNPGEKMLQDGGSSGGGTSPSRLQVISNHIKSSIIEDSGKLRREAWGLAEMKICAMLLSGSTSFANMETCLDVHEKEIDGHSRLVYEFRMMKPKQLCAVLPKTYLDKIGSEQRANLKKAGMYFFESFEELTKSIAAHQSPASYRFFLLRCEPGTSIKCANIKDSIHQLPFRLIISTPGQGDHLPVELRELAKRKAAVIATEPAPLDQGPNELLHWLWQTWLTQRWLTSVETTADEAIEKAVVDIYLEQDVSESPTKEWLKHAGAFNRGQGVEGQLGVRIWTKNSIECVTGNGDFAGRSLLYDRHGGAAEKVWRKRNEQKAPLDFFNGDAYIFLDKLSADFSKIFCPAFPTDAGANGKKTDMPLNSWTLPYELIEAGLLRVLVIDERLAEKCYTLVDDTDARNRRTTLTGNDRDLPLAWHVAFGAKVYVGTHIDLEGESYPLHKQSYEQARERHNANSETPLPCLHVDISNSDDDVKYRWSASGYAPFSENLKLDVVIIHQGILDWLARDHRINQSGFLARLRRSIPFVVVDSGRGIPPNLEKTEKFIPFSVLQDYISSSRTSKHSLTQLIMSLTRRG